MAKTVKIPDNMSPWKAIINGIPYVYPAGATVEVPDEVADLIEDITNIEEEQKPVAPPVAMGGADWNASEGEPGHVLNRTHYSEIVQTEVFPEDTVNIMEDVGIGAPGFVPNPSFDIKEGAQYEVWMDGTKYSCTAFAMEVTGYGEVTVFGNAYIFNTALENTGEPFVALCSKSLGMTAVVVPTGADTATFRIVETGEVVHKLPTKYYTAAHYIDLIEVSEGQYGTGVTAEELNEMYASGVPMYVRLPGGGGGTFILSLYAQMPYLAADRALYDFRTLYDGNEMVVQLITNRDGSVTVEYNDGSAT
jgi:hypothetical protein